MKKDIKDIVIGILIFIIIVIILVLIFVELNNNDNSITNDDNLASNNEKEYDCSFTKSWRIVDDFDSYVAEVPEWSFVAVDQFQSHYLFAHLIPTELKETLEIDKYYEFTYHIEGTGLIEDMSDINEYLVLDDNSNAPLKVTLSINETDKEGLELINEDICE